MEKIIISVIGQDRPGIIAAISGILQENDCNIENVSQTILQGVFGALLLVAIPLDLEPDEIRKRLSAALADMKLDIFVRRYREADQAGLRTDGETHPFIITAFGPDRPGLVNAITTRLAKANINIRNLQGVFKGGDTPGDNIMIFEVDIPDEVDLPQLQAGLNEAAGTMNLDINIQHKGIFDAMNRI